MSAAGAGRARRVAAPSRGHAPLAAYVLRRWDWSETSLIVELFTRPLGRVVVVAKGAKRPTSQLRPVLLPFQPIQVQLGKAPADEQAEIRVLRHAEWAGGAPLLNAGAMFPAFYLNELLLKLLARQDPHPTLYDGYAETLAALADAAAGAAAEDTASLRAFELLLLRETGVLPDLSLVTATAEPLTASGGYTLRAEAGILPQSGAVDGAAWVAIEAALVHGSLAALRQACAGVVPGLRGPLRALLHYHLGTAPLRTREVWLDVQRLAADPAPR